MRYFTIGFFLLLSSPFWAQERSMVEGLVRSKDAVLGGVHIKNVSSGKFSISNRNGTFQLNMRSGDTLVLSHVAMDDLISFIKKEDLQKSPLHLRMNESSSELDEVVLNEPSEINAVSLGIIPKKIEKLSMNERRLRTAGDFKPIHLLGILGGSLEIDPILNAINGRTKKLKRNISIEKKRKNITFLEIHYLDYLTQEMNLSDQESQLLIGFVIEEKQLSGLIASGSEAQMQLYLHDAWFRFREKAKEHFLDKD